MFIIANAGGFVNGCHSVIVKFRLVVNTDAQLYLSLSLLQYYLRSSLMVYRIRVGLPK